MSFSGLYVGLSSLQVHRRALDVTGQNLANVNTEGYTRQRLHHVADTGPLRPAIFSRYEGTGMGVRANAVDRYRDLFLDVRSHQERGLQADLRGKVSTLGAVEQLLAEPSDLGLSTALSEFFAAWDDVANHPEDAAARASLRERGVAVANGLNGLDRSLAQLRATELQQLQGVVDDVNAIAPRIADLNRQIATLENGGYSGNELRDQRDLLAAQLSDKVGTTVRLNADGGMDVYVGSMAVVRGVTAERLAVVVDPDPSVPTKVVWAKDGQTALVRGEAAGHLSALNDVIPRYRTGLQDVAQRLHDEVNALHRTGFDALGNPAGDFFTMGPGGIEVHADVRADVGRIAASAVPGNGKDGSLAMRLADLTDATIAYRNLVVGLGVESQTTQRRLDVQDGVVRQVEAAREAISGVSIDEEMTNMVALQRAYDAAARFVSAVDETLQSLIALVGR